MREIKFRAWDQNLKKIITERGLSQMLDGGVIRIYGTYPSEKFKGNPFHQKDWEVMQYTGLKDSNEREIYEGDIVTSRFTKVTTCPVYFSKGQFRVTDPRGEIPLNYLITSEGTEVIGNIYENPELLTSN